MNFEEIREQIKERWQTLWASFQDSATYANLLERYESLSPNGQRAVIGGAIGVVVLLIVYIPWSYFESSSTAVGDFESKRELTRELLKVTRSANVPPPEHVSAPDLRGRVDNELRMLNVMPEQIASISEIPPEAMKLQRIAPPALQEEGLQVSLARLNLKQIIDIGYRFQNLSEVVKVSGLKIAASAKDPHYYDVTFQLASFSVPMVAKPEEKVEKKGRN